MSVAGYRNFGQPLPSQSVIQLILCHVTPCYLLKLIYFYLHGVIEFS